MKKFNKALFIFRRDLRLEDNIGLIFALANAKKVIPCFIFTPDQIQHNQYRSDRCLEFMIQSLEELEEELRQKKAQLFLFYDSPEKIVEKCIKALHIDVVVVNRDYTPYSIYRDQKIAEKCHEYDIPFRSFDDALLHPPEESCKSDGTPYTIFTPFYRNALKKLEVAFPIANCYENYDSSPIPFSKENSLYSEILPKRLNLGKGGRKAALNILKKLPQFSNYSEVRDFPSINGTTHLSPHLKFTTCSPREVYHAICRVFGPFSAMIRSLYWRDFFTCVAFYFPRVFQGAFHEKYNQLAWRNEKKAFKAWCEGRTGFPLIDAGMRQLNQTGDMHNRVRMVTASFLVKDLHIDWRWGENYFAQNLIDYDPAVNNGNWQWAASTGCDAQPYFRIFNPWSQQIKFDPECRYIKTWIKELEFCPSTKIHQWYSKEGELLDIDYPRPIVDHAQEVKIARELYTLCN